MVRMVKPSGGWSGQGGEPVRRLKWSCKVVKVSYLTAKLCKTSNMSNK